MAFSNQQATVYNDTVVRQFAIMTVVWGVVGMLVGVIIAAQLTWPELNFGIPWLSYGRLRPLHTNAVIFAFGGCGLFAAAYYVVQRTCHVRLFGDKLAAFTFWGWQAVIVLAAISLPLGYTQGKEYAELEWPIDILITAVWVAFAVVFFGTVGTRKVKHIYVANWFFGAFILAVALLHLVNSAAIPAGLMKSYSAYAGVQDAMVQWWYGHNAVGFFLTAGFLGMMYYFIPKQAERPVYSYRLSIVHFWALIFTYMWAGPHHLHYTALPDWTQSVGMLFSLILLAPSWGGMINGIMTLSGAWHKLLRHEHLRGPDDVDQDSQRLVPLHRLDRGPRALGRPRLGGPGDHGLDVLPDPAPVRPEADVQRQGHRGALLGRHHRHRDLHRRHVDCRRDAGPDVARHQPRRHADLHLRRIGQGHLSLLRVASAGWGALPGGHAHHALERDQDRHGRPRDPRQHSRCSGPCLKGTPPWRTTKPPAASRTRRSKPTTS
jgi:Cytochrome C and Quinol oxidase polypeptide I